MFKKRLIAYIIDILILNFILSIICSFIPTNNNIVNLNKELIDLSNNFIGNGIDLKTFVNRCFGIMYSMDKELFLTNLINLFGMTLYFIVYPLYNNGQSIGKKIQKIQVVGNDSAPVSSNQLIVRYMFISNFGTTLISMCLLFTLKDMSYVITTSILGFLQFLVVIISIFMILYRRDKRSLPDLIAGTKVIEVKE